jgi:phosphate/sulfate permease
MVIACLFTLELLCKALAFGLVFFRNIWHVLDSVLVIGSIVVNVVLYPVLSGVSAFLLVGRIIRLIRFGHGVAATKNEEFELLKQETNEIIHRKDLEIHKLQSQLP